MHLCDSLDMFQVSLLLYWVWLVVVFCFVLLAWLVTLLMRFLFPHPHVID